MHDIIFISFGLVVAVFMVVNGLLLTFWPLRFLRFYDLWNPGDHVGKTAPWRKNVEKAKFRLLGLGTLVMGAMMIWDFLHVAGWLR